MIGAFDLDAKIVQRKKHYIVYIKEGAQIVDMLNIMGAHISLMNLENIRIVRDMRNNVNRKVNCEAANINKTVNAAVRQLEDIRYLEATEGLEALPDGLADVAAARLAHPGRIFKRAWRDALSAGRKVWRESQIAENKPVGGGFKARQGGVLL